MRSLVGQVREWLADVLGEPGPRRSVTLAVGFLVFGLIFSALAVPSPGRIKPPVAVSEPVVTTEFVCPDFRGSTSGFSTTVVATIPKPITGSSKAGTAALTFINSKPGSRSVVAFDSKSGSAIAIEAKRARGSLVGVGRGGLAPGFSGGQLALQTVGVHRGLSGLHCSNVGSEQWIVGGGSKSGQFTLLYLSNVETQRASVNVDFFGPQGPVDAPSARGIVVPGRTTRVVAVDRLVPGFPQLAMHVVVTAGRLGMAVSTSERRGRIALGSDFIPAAAAPAQSVVIPAIPAINGTASLVVLAPGADDADVRIKVIGSDGTFSPVGGSRVTVGARSVRSIDLTAALQRENSGLILESDQPITASVRVRFKPQRGSSTEFAWTSATPAITDVAVEPIARKGEGFNARLVISAPNSVGHFELIETTRGGVVRKREFRIDSGKTKSIALGIGRRPTWFTALVRVLPDSGPLYAGRVQSYSSSGGQLLTISPLKNARINVDVPQALPDLSAAVPSAF